MEPEIRDQVDPAVRKEHLELMEISLEVDKIAQALDRIRKEGT
jgi:phosphopantetheine adenylyltransferase